MSDEKAVARDVLGRHYSDIDDTTSSESDDELQPALLQTPSVFPISLQHSLKRFQVTSSSTIKLSEVEPFVTGSTFDSSAAQESDDKLGCSSVLSQQVDCGMSHKTMQRDNVSACMCTLLTKQKRQSKSANCPQCPGGKVHKGNTQTDKKLMKLQPCRRSVPSKGAESSSSDDLEVVNEGLSSSCSEESEESIGMYKDFV